VIREVLVCPDIYEFDLKNFFGSVDQQYLLMDMLVCETKMPVAESVFIKRMLRRFPKLPKEQKLYEGLAAMDISGSGDSANIFDPRWEKIWAESESMQPGFGS
jgi:hypothetical protein